MNTVLAKANRHFLWQHPWQLALAVIGIALGVAVVVSIDLAMESALQSFRQSGEIFSGSVTHRIVAGDGGVDEKLYTRLRVDLGLQNLSPVVQGTVQLAGNSASSFRLYGIDPLAEQSFRSSWRTQLMTDDAPNLLLRLISEPGAVLLGKQTAQQLNIEINDRFAVVNDQGTYNLQLIGLLLPGNALEEQVLADLIVTDIASAQEVLGLFGKLSAIDIYNAINERQLMADITALLPANTLLLTPQNQADSMRKMTRAFAINLSALGLLSLLVGMFLIYNAMTFLVLQRRTLIGNLRCLGVTRGQIFKLILLEACVLAVCGTALGVMLGVALGQGLLHLIAGTIDAVYFRIDHAVFRLTFWHLGKGVLLGVSVTLLAALGPAWEATRWSPGLVRQRSQLEAGIKRLLKAAALTGAGFIGGGLLVTLLSAKSISLGLTGIFLLLFGFVLLTPLSTLTAMTLLERLLNRYLGVLGRLPPRMVRAEISRSGIAIAALMVAVSATIAMDLMIGSFRQTVAQWIQTSLRADLYVSVSGNTLAKDKNKVDRQLKDKLATLSEVAMLSSVLHTRVIAGDDFVTLSVFELNRRSRPGFVLKQSGDDELWQRFEQQQTVMVTEPFAYFHGIDVGEQIRLQTDNGSQAFEVVAIYADYSGDQGHIAMSRRNYLRYWPDLGYSGIGIYARTGTDLKVLQNQVRALLAPQQTVRSDSAIYTASMAIFEQTFSITETLRWLSASIAFVGVFSALMALQFERTREFGILRAIGVTPGQLSLLISAETALMGLIAGLFAVPVGYIVAYELIFVIYQRSFGWTMDFYMDSSVLWQGLFLAVIAAILAGIYPAYKMSKTNPAEALRTE